MAVARSVFSNMGACKALRLYSLPAAAFNGLTNLGNCLVPRSHRNAGLQPLLHAHVIREDDAPERQSKSTA